MQLLYMLKRSKFGKLLSCPPLKGFQENLQVGDNLVCKEKGVNSVGILGRKPLFYNEFHQVCGLVRYKMLFKIHFMHRFVFLCLIPFCILRITSRSRAVLLKLRILCQLYAVLLRAHLLAQLLPVLGPLFAV